MEDLLVELDGRLRVSLGKFGLAPHTRYLVTKEADGRLIFTPAAVVPEVEARLPGVRVIVELGRYLVGEAGIYVCRVTDRKVSRGQVFLITDGGMHHNLSASGNFGQVIRKNFPIAVGNRMNETAREIASVVGPLCTPLDVLADRMELAPVEVGDLIVVFQCGAYGLTASPLRFLSHPEPVEILV